MLRYLLTSLVMDVVGVGLPSFNNFQPITSFVSIAMPCNEIVVGVTFLRYRGKTRDLLPLRMPDIRLTTLFSVLRLTTK